MMSKAQLLDTLLLHTLATDETRATVYKAKNVKSCHYYFSIQK